MSQNRIIKFIASNWGVFSFFFVVAALLAVKHNYYSAKKYKATAGVVSESPIPANKTNLFSDIPFLHTESSPVLIEKIIPALINHHLTVEYRLVKPLHNIELYKNCPITVEYKLKNNQFSSQAFEFSYSGESAFNLTYNYKGIERTRSCEFDKPIHEAELILTISRNTDQLQFKPNESLNQKIEFTIFSAHAYAEHLLHYKIDINNESNITSVTCKSSNANKAADIANIVSAAFTGKENNDGLTKINSEINRTITLLDQAQATIIEYRNSSNLASYGPGTSNSITLQSLEETKLNLQLQARSLDNLSDYMRENRINGNAAPEFGTINDPLFAGYVAKLNEKIFQKKNAGAENSIIIDSEINYLKNILAEGIRNTRKKIALQTDEVNRQIASLGNSTAPQAMDAQLLMLERNKQELESHYNYLSNKRSELLFNASSANAKISYFTATIPASPYSLSEAVTWSIAAIAALVLSILVSFIKTIFTGKKKAAEIKNIESFFTLTVKGKKNLPDQFKELCTKLLLTIEEKEGQVISITSARDAAGNDFIATRLAKTLATYDAKVLLLHMNNTRSDDEVPNITSGTLANVLDKKTQLMEAISITSIPNLDTLMLGSLKGGINSLLAANKIQKIIAELRQHYNYIIIDGPSFGAIDAIPVLKISAITLFVLKSGLKIQKQVDSVRMITDEYAVSNFRIITNKIGSKFPDDTDQFITTNDEQTHEEKHENLPFLRRVALWFY